LQKRRVKISATTDAVERTNATVEKLMSLSHS